MTRVVVVGGGVIGLTIAWRVSQRGGQVTLIDPAPGSGASWVAGGMLAPVAEVARGEEAVHALAIASAARWADFARELSQAAGADAGYADSGTLIVARDGDDLAELNDLLALHQQWGLESERLTSRQARKLEPALVPSVRGGLWMAGDHQVDNRRLLVALEKAARTSGVGFVGEAATAITATTVTTASGVSIEADAVVVATGAQVPPLRIDDHAVTIPIRPVKGQILRVRATSTAVLPTRTVRGMGVYIIPRPHGEIVIGATVEEKGYDTTVTVRGVYELLRDASELVPGLAEAEFLEAIAGLRPGTPDNGPLLGPLGPEGPIMATGHYRHGVLLAPVTGEIVVGLIFGDQPREMRMLAQPFTPRRFREQARHA